jgi:hypothetical protein
MLIADSTISSRARSPVPPPAPSIKLCSVLQSSQDGQFICGYLPIPDSDPCQQLRIDQAGSNQIGVTRRPVHLHSFLSRKPDKTINRRLALGRKQRFGIAAALGWAVLHLCDTSWLGKKLNNNEIQLFLESQTGKTAEQFSSNPYLSSSFFLSTSNLGSSTTPVSQSEQFQDNQVRNMTLFTLAIRLIELGLNRSFTQIKQEYGMLASSESTRGPQTSVNATVVDDFKIAEDQIRELYLDPGKMYADAADRCLRFLFPGPVERNTFDYSAFRNTFFAEVVAPIQATYILIPGSCSQLDL